MENFPTKDSDLFFVELSFIEKAAPIVFSFNNPNSVFAL